MLERKNEVQRRSQFDRFNIADEIRGTKADSILKRIKGQFDKILPTGSDFIESDINLQASLEVGALNFLAQAKNVFGNLITLSIIDDGQIVASVDEEQSIDFDAVPDAGAWSISLYSEETAELAFDDDAAAVQTALRAINGLEDVTVTGDYSSGFAVVFEGTSSGIDHPLLVEETNTLENTSTPVVITITEDVAGVPGIDTVRADVGGSDIKIHCESGATNTDIKNIVEASTKASNLVSVTIDAGEEATVATTVSNAEFSGGA